MLCSSARLPGKSSRFPHLLHPPGVAEPSVTAQHVGRVLVLVAMKVNPAGGPRGCGGGFAVSLWHGDRAGAAEPPRCHAPSGALGSDTLALIYLI